jgi:hypothetical protein
MPVSTPLPPRHTAARTQTLRRSDIARAGAAEIAAVPLPRPHPDDAPEITPVGPRPARLDVPVPGVAVLACRCGQVLAMAEMHRPARAATPASGPTVEPIRCRRCATTI